MNETYSLDRVNRTEFPVIELIIEELKKADKELFSKEFQKIYSRHTRRIGYCNNLKILALKKNDEFTANYSFLSKINFTLIMSVAKFWQACENREYYESWAHLQDAIEQCMILLKFIDKSDSGHIKITYDRLKYIEKLYPYQLFCSTGTVGDIAKCSICGRNPLDPECDHILNELYSGEIACHWIKIGKPHHILLCTSPKDRRCVVSIPYDKEHPETGRFANIYSFIESSNGPL